jgi:hypothetical protein
VVGKLLSQGLIEEIPARGALPVWRRDDERGRLARRITQRGLAATRIEDGAIAEDSPNTKQAADVVSDKRPGRVAASRGKKKRGVRGFFAAVVGRKLGLTLVSEKTGEERVYRIVARDAAAKRKGKSGRKAA